MSTEIFAIKIQQAGAEKVTKAVDGVGAAAERTTKKVGRLNAEVKKSPNIMAQFRSALVAIAAVRAASHLVEFADSVTRMSNTLKVATSSTEEYNQAMNFLRNISRETRTDVEANATVYSRLLRSTQGLSFTTQDLEKTMRGLTLAVKVGGATSQEARNSLIQFSQSLASGALRGDELRSVAEQLPALANAIGKEFGVAGGQLLAFAKANPGVLETEKVIRGVMNGVAAMEEQFKKMGPTLTEGFIAIRNELLFFIQDVNNSTGVLNVMAWALIGISRSINVLIPVLAALAGAWAISTVTAYISQLVAANNVLLRLISTGKLWTATMTVINAVMMRNPFALIATAIGVAVYALVRLYQESEIFRTGINNIIAVLGAMWNAITTVVSAVYTAVASFNGWSYATEAAGAVVYVLAHAIGGLLMTALSALLAVLAGATMWMNEFGLASDETTKKVVDAANDAAKAAADWYVFGKGMGDATDKTAGLGESFKNLRGSLGDAMGKISGAGDETEKTANKLKDADNSSKKFSASMWDVGLTAEEAANQMGGFVETTSQWVSLSGDAYNGLNGMASGLAGVAANANAAAGAIRNMNTVAAASRNTSGGSSGSGPKGTALRGYSYSGNSPMSSVSMASLPARASGGPVSAGTTYLVGENGPEAFTANQNGQIVNNRKLMQTVAALEKAKKDLDSFWAAHKKSGAMLIGGQSLSQMINLQKNLQKATDMYNEAKKVADAEAAKAYHKSVNKELKQGFGADNAINLPGFENYNGKAAPKIDFQTLTPWQGGKDYGTHTGNMLPSSSGGGGGSITNQDNSDNRVSVVVQVNTPDAGSFRQNQAQIEAGMLAAVERAQRRKMRR